MKYPLARLIPILFFVVFLAPQLSAQNIPTTTKETKATVDSTVAPIIPYAVTEISQGANNTTLMAQKAAANQLTDEEQNLLKTETDSFFFEVDPFIADTAFLSISNLNSRELENAISKTSLLLNQIATYSDKLDRRYKDLEEDYIALADSKKKWLLTKNQSGDKEVPEELVSRIDVTIGTIDSVSSLLQGNMKELLLVQDRVLDRNNKLLALKNNLQTASQALSQDIFARDMPGFFIELKSLSDTSLMPAHIKAIRSAYESDMHAFKTDFSGNFIFILVFFILLAAFLYWFKYNHSKVISEEKVVLNPIQKKLVQSPFMTAVFVASALFLLGFPDLPFTIRIITIAMLIIPLAILAVRFFGLRLRPWVLWLTSVFLMTIVYELMYSPDILQRLLLLFLSMLSLMMYGRTLFLYHTFKLPVGKGMVNLIHNILRLFLLVLLVAIVANFIGAFSLAEFFTLAPVQITFNLLIILVIIKFVDLALYLLLGSKFMLKLNVIADFFDMIHKRLSQIVSLGFWIFFMVQVLRILKINQGFFSWWTEFFTTKKKIGDAELSLESLAIFVFVIWLSLFLTKVVRYVLEKDVFVRIPSSKGTPGTVIMMVRIIMITGGFFLAARAAGMALTNLSIILGAFSVGIGFGLQNIFNNMVSGFILAVERPISVGDTVEVGTLMGTVKNIGLRASRVRSFDGAEMIVPNGMLISEILINWTLSDAYRRMDIRVGLAYGTDPNVVIDILDEVAAANKKVRKYPAPAAYFIDFGDSSLNFRLLAWVKVDDRLSTESEIKTAINEKLKEAGLEIPFPQHDLHIRSDDTKPAIKPAIKTAKKPAPKTKPEPKSPPKAKPDTSDK